MKFPFSVLLAMSLIACGEDEPKEEVDHFERDSSAFLIAAAGDRLAQ